MLADPVKIFQKVKLLLCFLVGGEKKKTTENQYHSFSYVAHLVSSGASYKNQCCWQLVVLLDVSLANAVLCYDVYRRCIPWQLIHFMRRGLKKIT